tara:strand:+ start:261 stop:1589 length:1329 start_codon:yes stop_codon:yes gene_type:complete
MASLDEPTKDVFDEIVTVQPFSRQQIQSLSDLRIRRMSNERWHISGNLLDAIMSRTGGNARSVIGVLRDLVDERRGLGSEGTLDSLRDWRPKKKEIASDHRLGDGQLETFERENPQSEDTVPEETVEDWPIEDEPETGSVENEEEEEGWDVEPDDMWPEEGPTREDPVVDEIDEEELGEIAPDSEISSESHEKITGWSAEEGTVLSMDEGTEPPASGRNRGFSGLLNRSRITNDTMPTGPDYSVAIQEPDIGEPKATPRETPTEERQQYLPPEQNSKSISTETNPFEEKKVLFSEGELWTVDSDLEETLPEFPSETEFEPELDPEETFEETEITTTTEERPRTTVSQTPIVVKGPSWESNDSVDQNHLGSMSDAERLVVSVASSREISPSDAEIQARLEVGRPRLSQIYNSLHKSGILAVRKEGRSRLFKLSEGAGALLSEG